MNSEFKAFLELLWMLIIDPHTGLLIGLLLAAALSDYKTGRIPNLLVLPGLCIGLAYNTIDPPFVREVFPWAFEGMGITLAIMLPLYLMRTIGAGDVKLMAMAGAFLGFPAALWATLYVFLAGGLLSLAYIIHRGALRRALSNIAGMLLWAMPGYRDLPAITLNSQASVGTLPYGIAIAAGTTAYLVLHQLGYIQ